MGIGLGNCSGVEEKLGTGQTSRIMPAHRCRTMHRYLTCPHPAPPKDLLLLTCPDPPHKMHLSLTRFTNDVSPQRTVRLREARVISISNASACKNPAHER